MTRIRHAAGLSREIALFAVVNRAWWIVPIILALAAATLVVVVGQAAAPVTLYPLF